MKVHANYIILFVFLILTSCISSHKENKEKFVIQPVNLIDDNVVPIVSQWITNDGLKVISETLTEYFFIRIEKFPETGENGTEIYINHQKFSDSLIYENTSNNVIDTSLYVAYWLNTLDVFEIENEHGLYFFTSLQNPVGGLDPELLIMWIYFKEKIYKCTAIIPLHEDWNWDEIYQFTPDKNLEKELPVVYMKTMDIWLEFIEKYKQIIEKGYIM